MRGLVTGGAGLIGSHLADLLLQEGWKVRILDNLEPQTHRHGKPGWVPDAAEFLHADVRDRAAWRQALAGVDVVFHQACYGGYMPDMAKLFEVNSVGTAHLLETIRDGVLPVRKVVVASSQAVYPEGAGRCSEHGVVFPAVRPIVQMQAGDYEVHCPNCTNYVDPVPTPERAPIGADSVYALTKGDQERMTLSWGRMTGIPTVALRYSCTYGPRQSIFNPYTGVIAIFSTRLLNGMPPVLYEDGRQTRDMCFVEDIARANLLVALSDKLDGLPVNVGSGEATTVARMADLVADVLGVSIAPDISGEFRPNEIRHLTSDIELVRSIGYAPSVRLADGIQRYVNWIREQGDVREYFSEAERVLRSKGVVHRLRPESGSGGGGQ